MRVAGWELIPLSKTQSGQTQLMPISRFDLMKIAIVTAVAVVVVSSIPLFAQQAGASAQQSVQANAGNRSVSESSAASASADRSGVAAGQMTSVNGQLENKLDSKSARVGDQVIVKTTEKTRTADGMEIPKGSRLIGHVTSVQAHGSGNEDSSMGIAFDRAELHNGQSMAIHSAIQSLSPAANMAASSAADDDMAASGGGGGLRGGGGAAVRGGGSAGGGGLLGGATGAVGGTVRGVGSTAGAVGSGVASTTGSVASSAVSTTGQVAGGATAAAGNTVRGTAQGAGSLTARMATGIPGVMLAGDASGATSGMLSASRKNIHLDSGTQVVLGVSSAVNRQ
jgi:hypothetical protein